MIGLTVNPNEIQLKKDLARKRKLQEYIIYLGDDRSRWNLSDILQDYHLIIQGEKKPNHNTDLYFIDEKDTLKRSKFKIEIRKGKLKKFIEGNNLKVFDKKEIDPSLVYQKIRKIANESNNNYSENILIGNKISNQFKDIPYAQSKKYLEFYLSSRLPKSKRNNIKLIKKNYEYYTTGSLYRDKKDFHCIIRYFTDNMNILSTTKPIEAVEDGIIEREGSLIKVRYNKSFDRYDKTKNIINECYIERSIIKEAINNLTDKYFALLYLWCFDGVNIPLDTPNYKNKSRLLNNYIYRKEQSKSKYNKLYYSKNKVLHTLRANIINLQS